MFRERVLFICVHNSGRSQIAEALLRNMAGNRFDVESAGFEPGPIDPLVVKAMAEIDIDISQAKSKSAFEYFKEGRLYSHVITVCHDSEDKCPVFPGQVKRQHWPFEDPSRFTGTDDKRLNQIRLLRDKIKQQIENWLREQS